MNRQELKAAPRVVLVGEANPYGGDPRYALYCEPRNSAGGRLCFDILRMSRNEYVRTFGRVNLCPSKWSAPTARARALELALGGAPLVLFGAKVCSAFGMSFDPFTIGSLIGRFPEGRIGERVVKFTCAILPHPSGLCRRWGEPPGQTENFARARKLILDLRDAAERAQAVATAPAGGEA